MSQKEVVIVGAGVIGCSIAYHLARRGVPSQVIERDSIAARASGKAWAVWVYPPRWLTLEGQSLDRLFSMPAGGVRPWLELFWIGYHRLPDMVVEIKEKVGLDVQFGELPFINVALSESEEEVFKASLSMMRSAGYYEGDWLEANDIRDIFLDINRKARGGLIFPYFQVEPYRYTLGLAQVAEKLGASIRQGEVVGFRRQGSKATSVILATGTEVEADVFVLAMGPWSGQGTSWLGKEIAVRLNRDECLRLEVLQRPPCYAIRTSAGHTIIPKVDGSVLLGHAGVSDLQTDFDVSLTTEEAKTDLLNGAIQLLPSLKEAKLIEHRGDFEAYSPPPRNIQPVMGRLPKWDNVYIAARFNTQGMLHSLGAGQCVADLIVAGGRAPDRVKNMMEILSPDKL